MAFMDELRIASEAVKEEKSFRGVPVHIEWPKGSVREGEDKNGKAWKRPMHCDYGFIPDTITKGDGEELDVYLGPNEEAPYAYVVEQLKEDGSFDEYKTMLGFDSLEEAEKMYLSHYPQEWADTRVGEVFETPVDDLLGKAEEHRKTGADMPYDVSQESDEERERRNKEFREALAPTLSPAADNTAWNQAMTVVAPGLRYDAMTPEQQLQVRNEAIRLKALMK